jgi:serine/threonine protein phosphatase PrpC
MKIKILLCSIALSVIAHASEQKAIIAWGMSARANGKVANGIWAQEDKFSQATINRGHFFGVFDGHGDPTDNNQACNILKDKLHVYFEHASGDEQARMLEAFQHVETLAREYIPRQGGFNLTGSTAVVAYISNGLAHVAHAGDSRAIFFGKTGTIHFATQDHDFDNENEFNRIKAIYPGDELDKRYSEYNRTGKRDPRVNSLPMSRVIGNARAKWIFNKGDVGDGAIIGIPEYNCLGLTDNSTFLVMATDGLWDVMTNEEVMTFVNDNMDKSIETLKQRYTDCPLTAHIIKNRTVRNTVRHLMNMSEEDFNKNETFKKKPWDVIAQENNISVDKIRETLKITEEDFESTYPQNENPDLGRTPMHYDFVEEECGNKIQHDEKCMLVARALRDHAVALGSQDNILVTVIDLSHPHSVREIIHGW